MTAEALRTIPRVRLATLPTPLHPAPRLSAELGTEIWFKRDDLTGIGIGGNKVRVLEFLLGDGLAQGCDVLLTGSGPQSNWSFLAALAARRCGLEPHLCFYGEAPRVTQGNLLLHRMTGAALRWTGETDRTSVDRMLEEEAERLREQGRRPLVLPRGGATGRGSVGYAVAADELAGQAAVEGLDAVTTWTATGSCGTQAGLLVGVARGVLGKVVGVTVSRPVEECRERVHTLAAEAASLLGAPPPRREDVQVLAGWAGAGYGIPSPEGRAAQQLVARTEGVLLDPVFGAKAMAALVDAAQQGTLPGPVVFLVTGGAPTLFLGDETGARL